MTDYFEEKITIGLRKLEKDKIQDVIDDNKNMYENHSHFIRCAVIRLLRAHKEGRVKDKEME